MATKVYWGMFAVAAIAIAVTWTTVGVGFYTVVLRPMTEILIGE